MPVITKKTKSKTIAAGSRDVVLLTEGMSLTVTGSAGVVATANIVDPILGGANYTKTIPITVGVNVPIGPLSGDQRIVLICTTGSIDSTIGASDINAATAQKNASGDIVSLTNGDATIAVAIGPYSFSALPSAASYPGYRAKVSDVGGAGGSLWVSNSTRWCPENGRVTLGSLAARATTVGVTEIIVKQWLIPAGVIQNFDRFRLRATMSKSGTAETVAFALRFGPLGTVADTQIFSNSNMATTNVSMGVDTEFKRLSATTILRSGVGSIGSSYNAVSTAAFASAITVANMDTNPMYLSVTLRSAATGAETIALEDAIYDLLGYVP